MLPRTIRYSSLIFSVKPMHIVVNSSSLTPEVSMKRRTEKEREREGERGRKRERERENSGDTIVRIISRPQTYRKKTLLWLTDGEQHRQTKAYLLNTVVNLLVFWHDHNFLSKTQPSGHLKKGHFHFCLCSWRPHQNKGARCLLELLNEQGHDISPVFIKV